MGNSGRFMDGVLFGAILGGAAVFLLGTKKGNKVLKILTEEGIAGFNEIVEEFEDIRQGVKPAPKAMKVEEVDDNLEDITESPKTNGENHNSKPKSSKRFFRKSK